MSTHSEMVLDPVEKRRLGFQEWYAKSKDAHNAKRRNRYREDEDYRLRVKELAKQYRKSLPPKPRKKIDRMTILELCEKANCGVDVFKKYQKQGWVPKSTKGILFTDTHVAQLSALIEKARETKYLKTRLAVLTPYINAILTTWVVSNENSDE